MAPIHAWNRRIFYILILVFILSCRFLYAENTSLISAGKNKFVPPEGKTLLVIGQDIDSIEEYIKTTQIIPAGFMVYTSVNRAEGLDEPVDFGNGISHAQFLVEKYSNTIIQIGLYMCGILEEICSGDFDENIDRIGAWIQRSARPVYLRIGYEFDFPENNYDPGLYKQAYQYIVNRFRKNKITNIAYVWHSFASLGRYPIIKWYPGDEYVDWIGLSFFRNDQRAYAEFMAKFAKEHNKPLMMAEATPYGFVLSQSNTAWKQWFIPCLKYISKKNVGMFSYINVNWDVLSMWQGQGWGDTRVQADKDIMAQWMQETRKDKYLKSSPELFKILNYQEKTRK